MKKNGKKKPYFGEEQHKAVLDYINTESAEEKNRIYNKYLAEPFRIMKETIIRRYPTHIGNYDVHEVESNALSHLIEQMVKFNPDAPTKTGKRTKAYSYCQTIIRNYYIDHSKRSFLEKKTNLSFENFAEEIEENPQHSYDIEESEENEIVGLINVIIEKIENEIETNKNLKKNEIIVGDAIINILKNWDLLFMEDGVDGVYDKRTTNKFAKNKILLLLKEQTGLSTKEMRIAMKQFKELYFFEKNNFFTDR
jgi:hypothetical protein